MSDPLIYSHSNYVVLEPGKEERLLSEEETLQWLKGWLGRIEIIPEDLKNQPSTHAAAKRLLETACDLEYERGFILRWFAVRLDPPQGS